MTNERLLKGCRQNNRKAQNELFRRYKQLVMNICRRYIRETEQAQDLFQECFIQIFKSVADPGLQVDNLEAWIARICINTNAKHYYRQVKHQHDGLAENILDTSHQQILEGLTGEQIMEVVRALPDGFRVVFNMYFIDGYKHAEIAEMLRISESTSRSQLTRAKALLKKELEAIGIYKYEAS